MELKDIKVLICDDSVLIRKKLKEALTNLGCETIIEAEDGQVAVHRCKEHYPDIVFLDIVMPEKDGITALTEIKEVSPDTKVVMASSAGTQSHLKKAIQLGAYDFIQKPLNNEAIDRVLQKVLSESEESHV
ncbi:response regulator [Alkalihalobacillus sp. LMS39]|uniref:response regulator n=1 Tax=Alkalihalobacillus sp. LMS39 TaxID=2924032 RepID=UPI001FB3F108|nr:response regulator [Alkalihalobacillus sp. LMS39]UOE95392.1 response regulator [Alkalihalobacillus sp. LMS39]